MISILRSIDQLRACRATAMNRARHARAVGIGGEHIDVAIARRSHRQLMRLLRGFTR